MTLATDTEALTLPAQFHFHPLFWILKAFEFYLHHEQVFDSIAWAILGAGIFLAGFFIVIRILVYLRDR